MRQHGLPTIEAAIEWLERSWSEQPAPPLRLHDHAVGSADLLGAPRISSTFWRYLTVQNNAIETVSVQEPCYHPRLAPGRRCPDCLDVGYHQISRDRYTWPMRVALDALRHDPGPWSAIVYSLAAEHFDVDRTARRNGRDSTFFRGLALTAIRKLYNRYSSTPVHPRRWTDLSESQQAAESGGG